MTRIRVRWAAIRFAIARCGLVAVAVVAEPVPAVRAASPYLGVVTTPDATVESAVRTAIAAAPVATPSPRAIPPVPPIPSVPALPRLPLDAWYGISLRCSDCSIFRDEDNDEVLAWRFRSEPEILDVEPDSPADRAGVRSGDILTHVEGHEITSREGGRRFGAAQPGDTVRWTVRDGRKSRDVTVVAGERLEGDRRSWAAVRDELRAAREALRAQRDKLRALHYDEARLHELDASRESLEDMARSLADLERQGLAMAPEALMLDPDRVVLLPDRGDGKDPVRIVQRDRRVHRLRYTGDIGDSRVEVRGSSAVVVTEEKNGDLVIDTPDASIRVKKKR